MLKYQRSYAAKRPEMYNSISRNIRAIRMVKLLRYHLEKESLKNLNVLDVGASTGIIDYELSKYFKSVTGIDIDKTAIIHAKSAFKRKNLVFKEDDAMKLSFKTKTFDIVICSQVYEHVPDAQKLLNEIYRILKPNGVCYFAALNKFWPMEPHYNLPFLSWLPKHIANKYVSITGKASQYYETLRSRKELKILTKKFFVYEYTSKILRNPKEFGFDNLSKFPINIASYLFSFVADKTAPTFFWLLVKK